MIESDERNQILDDFLERWEERNQQGNAPEIADLCRDHPELEAELRRRIERLGVWDRFEGKSDEPESSTPPPPDGDVDSTADHAHAQAPPHRTKSDPDEVPPSIGRYTVIGLLGRGSFGSVYRARDEHLDRFVAIKVPRRERIQKPEDIEAYLAEARILAGLDHPHIVPVYDFGLIGNDLCYVVSKFLDGADLADRLKQSRPSHEESARMVEIIAEALHYAHSRGLVHRDIKPANILIDAAGRPCVADFGLALKAEDFGRGSRFGGSPAYMSPEQARGEGHRVDGRSDIYSLGVVFYEMLAGKHPFHGKSVLELLDLIATTEVPPPRQLDGSIPRELERICLKALAKPLSDRYTTATDMAEDLRFYLQNPQSRPAPGLARTVSVSSPGDSPHTDPQLATLSNSEPNREPIKIVPKGLRSFDEHDADFFLELLPGPRDRDGLPESLRFWKTRVEATDPEKAFLVGLIYGLSGCGKSSLMKAGLLPRLADHVVPVYLEATPEETEAGLLRGLRRACPDLSPEHGLVESLSLIRQGRVLRSGRKVLLVLDQFEQWLHARRGEENTELVTALRQCDGRHVQAIVMVRADFWMAATVFLNQLDIRQEQGRNIAAVERFQPRHARKVLAAFGTAYGALPERPGEIAAAQNAFLDQAVEGLTEKGEVIPVRLALFAQMVREKPWLPATLKDVGGMEGVGVRFLDESLSSSQAPPHHRLHQRAAQRVLKALLPELGTDIKGGKRTEAELREAAEYEDRPRDFDALIRILNADLRLITPTEPEGGVDRQTEDGRPVLHFQLTHDYLVPSLREWLRRKAPETARGRAEIALEDRAAIWKDKKEDRQLPSLLEWARIKAYTRPGHWTAPQRQMMTRAGRVHGLRTLGVLAVLALLSWGGFYASRRLEERNQQTIARGLVDEALNAEIGQILATVEKMDPYRSWIDPLLKEAIGGLSDDSPARLKAAIALLPTDPENQLPYLQKRLLSASSVEVPAIRDALEPHKGALLAQLWPVVDAAESGDVRLLPAAAALADYDARNPKWDAVSAKVAEAMARVSPVYLRDWLEAFRPVRLTLNRPMAAISRDTQRLETERSLAITVLEDYAQDDPTPIAELLLESEPEAYKALFPIAERHQQETIPIFRDEMTKTPQHDWGDAPLDPTWARPDERLAAQIEGAHGMLGERFAFVQTMPLDEAVRLAEALKPAGYRPIRFRPYADGETTRVAAAWTRDGRAWQLVIGRTADAIGTLDDENRENGRIAVDVGGYLKTRGEQGPAEAYAALWVQKVESDADARIVLTASSELAGKSEELRSEGLTPLTLQWLRGAEERQVVCGVWQRGAADPESAEPLKFGLQEADLPGLLITAETSLIDLSVHAAPKERTTRERTLIALRAAEAVLNLKPDDLQGRFMRALSNARLGEIQKALDDLDALIEKTPQATILYQHRAIAHARLGHEQEALADLERFQEGDDAESAKLDVAVIVAAELDHDFDEALKALETALREQPQNADLHYDAACACALASRAFAGRDEARGRALADRANNLLRTAIEHGYGDYQHMQEDPDLDPLRELPAFAEILQAGRLDRQYSAVWADDYRFEPILVSGLDPASHLLRGQELIGQGYRPVSVSACRTSSGGEPVTASVWHRPVISEDTRDQLAKRQARAAIALFRLGHMKELIGSLVHSGDPRLRGFLVSWLQPFAADAKALATEYRRLPSGGKPTPTAGEPRISAVLFHPETSQRRALILALGTYGAEGLPSEERTSLVATLFDVYRDDPDSGIHGAAAWTLRQWGEVETLATIDRELTERTEWGDRRWYINGQGQTFAIIEAPIEFRMGSPPTEPERTESETLHVREIRRPYALAATEVSVRQFQAFLREKGISFSYLEKYSPDPDGPQPEVSWYLAAQYCDWLSEKEGLDPCYQPNSDGEYAAGMTIRPDALLRNGYRLPTEAEWEYACRSGSETSRAHGASVELLRHHARFAENSLDHAWPCGSLMPNDLGLFDLLGNVYEWCQDAARPFRPDTSGRIHDSDTIMDALLDDALPRLLRGGAFTNRPVNVRSAYRSTNQPSYRNISYGFRPSRTYD